MITSDDTVYKTDSWLKSPDNGHAVHLYRKEDDLLDGVAQYVCEGLGAGDTCIVIATVPQIARMEDKLCGTLNLHGAIKQGRYLVFDAAEMLGRIIREGQPDAGLFNKMIGSIVRQATRDGQRLRIYGGMVSLLWHEGDRHGVLRLEELWNGLLSESDFSLYCAYPRLHFMYDRALRNQVIRQHSMHLDSDS